jgi:predicted phosphodiesterase
MKRKKQLFQFLITSIIIIPLVLLILAFSFEIYTLIVHKEGASALPPLFGNFPANREILDKHPEKRDFDFAAVGDVSSKGTFERIVSELRKIPLDFVVLLGDVSHENNEDHHRYLRAELGEYELPCPMFYVVGNHDVDPKNFPVARFEKVYGPSIFSFEYRKCLFIVLRILDTPRFTNKESLAFLAKFRKVDLSKYLHTFIFFHIPPSSISPFFHGHAFAEEKELLKLIDELGIDYVFTGDFHGFAQCKRANTNYIITGGGGATLRKKPDKQFYHATIIHVTTNSVDERILSVPRTVNFEDYLEHNAITCVWPWMQRNIAITIVLNLIGAAAFVFLICLIISMRKRKSIKAAARE